MKVGFLGAGTWGVSLASILAANGHEVTVWTARKEVADMLNTKREHPKLPHYKISSTITFTTDLKKALTDIDLLVEAVTSLGVRPVFEQVRALTKITCPIVITSKGIEKDSGLLLHEVLAQVMGEECKSQIGCLSGPSMAEEVIQNLPTSVVCSAYERSVMEMILMAFSTPFFRIYPNNDIKGVAFGGAMKNIMAIACGISDGLGYGDNTKAALMTRGLHEMRKLCVTKDCDPMTINGLAGLGDLCVTCLSTFSRNYNFGKLIASGLSPDQARDKIGMVVEGVYACVSALQLGKKANIAVPITEAIYAIVYDKLDPKDAVRALLQREIKEEHL